MGWKFDALDPTWVTLECSCCGCLLPPGSMIARNGSGLILCRPCFLDNSETEAEE